MTGLSERTRPQGSPLRRTGEYWQAGHTQTHTHTNVCLLVYICNPNTHTHFCLRSFKYTHLLSLLLSFFSCPFSFSLSVSLSLSFTHTHTQTHTDTLSRRWVAWLGDKAAIRPSSGTAALSSVMAAFFSIGSVNSPSCFSSLSPLPVFIQYIWPSTASPEL